LCYRGRIKGKSGQGHLATPFPGWKGIKREEYWGGKTGRKRITMRSLRLGGGRGRDNIYKGVVVGKKKTATLPVALSGDHLGDGPERGSFQIRTGRVASISIGGRLHLLVYLPSGRS